MSSLHALLGLSPSTQELTDALASINSGNPAPDPEVKSYPDAVYFNYYPLGLSILFTPRNGYKPKIGLKYSDLDTGKLSLDSIDVYNVPKAKDPKKLARSGSSRSEIAYATFPALPLAFALATDVKDKSGVVIKRPDSISISVQSTGKDLVSTLGEPDRKGGGAGPSSGSIGIWCEWSNDGIMIEFGGDEARGPQAWERGKDAAWKVITIFKAKSS
ncbi:hypothetical protein FA13DRAFT_1785267 [Coprinellus micaceus]|uniref:Uncharacterized protein n=1 Tax=Coprinellus micaceus TaxID=71717 RepID=A0A4Y7TYB3_COPMI|nr:hypothetical protein FA13DRAFT_1785267 [Coprinellus micaceus]